MRFLKQLAIRHYFRRLITYILIYCMFFNLLASVVLAGPEGAEVIHGQVSMQQSGLNTVIHASDKSIINYTSFDIARPEVVQFIQPGSNASVLNRILSANPTRIDGTLLANGRVFFVNPAGVIIGSGATINVNQFVASGLNISNDSFINGQYEFVGGCSSVANYGDISAQSVYLVGKQVTNAGNINCPEGYVVMAAGDRVFLGQPGSNVIVEIGSLEPPDQVDAQTTAEITNEGTVEAAGGTIILAVAGDALSRPIMSNIGSLSTSNINGDVGDISLHADNGLFDNSGTITATGNSDTGGTITIVAGEIINNGTIDVTGTQGGTVALEATDRLGQFGTVSADGIENNGGNISLTADNVVALSSESLTTANAGVNGDGGEVIVFSPNAALFEPDAQVEAKGGSKSGDGGFFEVSGKKYLEVFGEIDLTTTNGTNGMVVIDPLDLWIVDDDTANGDVSESSPGIWKPIDTTSISQLDIDILEGYLGSADVTLSTKGTPDAEGQFGDIIFDADRYLNSGTDALGNPTAFSLTVEVARNIEFTAGDGIKFQGDGDVMLYAGGHIISADRSTDTISTLRGDIIMETASDGSGVGIDIGGLTVGASGLDYPGEIRLSTTDSGNITTESLSVQGNGYGSIYVFSSGDLTINGSTPVVSINTNHVPTGEDAFSFVCLTAEKDATINGDVEVGAHGKRESVAGIWIGAGTNVQDPVYGYDGTVTVNGNLVADASVPPGSTGLLKSDATIRIYASTINLNGNKYPKTRAKGGSIQYQDIITGFNDSEDALYEEEVPGSPDPIHDELISGSRAMIDIDITKDGTCLNCGNVILPIALPDWLKESKNIMVYAILVLANDEDGEGGALIGGTVFLDGVTQSIEGGTLTLINGDTEVQYEPPSDWVFDENGEFTDYFEYYAVDADGEISANPALVTITLINQLPVANPDIYDVSHNVTLDITDITSGTIEGLLPGSADTDPDPGDTLSAYLSGGSTTALGGSVALNPDGTFTYTPPADTANVDDSFSYYVTDSYNNSDPTTVTISLTNQVPVANPDIYDVSHNVTLDITDITSGTIEGLLPGSEDTDPDPSDTLSAYLSGGVTTTLGGSVALNPDGTFTYTPPPDTANVDDSFMYYVTDSYDNSDPVSVTISLTNQLPVANPDIYDVSHNVTLDITDITSGTIEGLLPGSEDTDPDPGDTLSAFLSGGGTTTLGGSVVLNTDGTFTYTPPADTANVDDSFSYYVTDSYNNSDPTTVTISLTNQVPVANPDIYDVSHNVTLDITDITSGTIEGLLPGSADIDPDPGDTLSAFLPGGGNMGTTTLGGSVVLNTDGTFTYTPPAGTANVDDSFSYYVTDSYNNSDPTTVTISLTNQVPVANPDIYDVSHNAILSPAVGIIEGLIQAYADIDPDPGDTLRAYLPGKQSSGSTMLGGHVELNTDGTFTYTPPAGAANVDDSFMYYVTDSYNDSNPVPVTITLGMRTLASEEALLNSTPLSPDISDIGQIEDTTTSNNLQWLGEELGLCEGDQQGEDENQCQEITQAYLAGAFLQASDMRPHQAAAQLRELAELLHDSDGIRIAALARVINEFAQPNLPPTPEQFASINQAFTLHVNDGSHYAAAKQWLDALGEYTMLLISEIGWSSDDSVAFVMGKYGPTDTETGNISVIAFIQIHLEDFAG